MLTTILAAVAVAGWLIGGATVTALVIRNERRSRAARKAMRK